VPDPYDRYGMDLDGAQTLTGDASLVDTDLHGAEADLVDLLAYTPPADQLGTVSTALDDRLRAFGRAVAWQATHRAGIDDLAAAQGQRISSERWPDHQTDYDEGHGPVVTPLSGRAFAILTRFGWYVTSGYTSSPAAPSALWSRV
jgi:hypothetical protein